MKLNSLISWVTGYGLAGGLMAALTAPPLQAETITIGGGSGIIWEGLPFSERLSGPMKESNLKTEYGLLSISTMSLRCLSSKLITIAGYKAYPLPGATGVGIIPRASGLATFRLFAGETGTLTATLGLPETVGTSTTAGSITYAGNPWCVPPENSNTDQYYDPVAVRTATLSGTWAIVADGSQKYSEISMPNMYFGSFSGSPSGDRVIQIFPNDITLRVSTLTCTVNTPTTIDFGTVMHDSWPNAELATTSVSLTTGCGQDSDRINANINLQFRALTELYEGDATRLALKQGGGYITGEIDNGVTGSGACDSSSGVNFNNKPIKLGQISSTASSLVLKNQLTWRLCSGGSSLPTGGVDAAAELLVTFN